MRGYKDEEEYSLYRSAMLARPDAVGRGLGDWDFGKSIVVISLIGSGILPAEFYEVFHRPPGRRVPAADIFGIWKIDN